MSDGLNADRSSVDRSSWLPLSSWRHNDVWSWFKWDVVAGLTLAAYAVPVSMAYASLAGVPPQCGIYCYLPGGIAYALFGASRQLAIGPTSAIAMLVGTTVAGIADGNPERWLAIASLTALVVAVICGLAWWLRLSGLMNFVSDTILIETSRTLLWRIATLSRFLA